MMDQIPTMQEFSCGNCANCPRIISHISKAESLGAGAEAIATAVLSEDTDEIAKLMSEHLPENAALIGPDGESRLVKSAEDIVAAMRAITTAFLDGLDERRERIADDIADLHDGCPGPLKMRAEKAGQLVTVTVCMSPNAPTDQATEETIVQREPKSNP